MPSRRRSLHLLRSGLPPHPWKVATCHVSPAELSSSARQPRLCAPPLWRVLFAENRGIARLDNNATGPSNGDLVHRELALSRTLSGAVIGVSYSQSEIVAYNPEAKTDIRRVDVEDSLPGGWLFIRGMSKLPIGSLPQAGWTDTYAVIGGTGTYAGVHGYERLTLLPDGKTFKCVFTLWH